MSIFQKQSFFSFINKSGFLRPFRYFVRRDGHNVGIIQGYIQSDGGLVKRFLSRRAIINGGPWLAEDITSSEVESLIKECICGLKKEVIFIETRNFEDFSRYRAFFEKEGFAYLPHYDFLIDTRSIEVVDSHMGKSRRRDVNASLKSGVSVIYNPTEEEVMSFYRILGHLYRTKVKTPLFPVSFFLNLLKEDFSQFIFVKYQGGIIGGAVLVYDDETVYEWFACGMDGVFKNVFPSTVATYYGIRFAAEKGFKRFDMMGAGAPGDSGYGVREFKAKFGGELVEFGRFRFVCNKALFRVGELGVKVLKRLK